MKFLFDTDHVSILQSQHRPEYDAIIAQMAKHPAKDLGFSLISFHEQVLGAHTYITRARNAIGIINGYQLLEDVLLTFSRVSVVPYDAAAAAVFDNLVAQRVRIATMDLRLAASAMSRGLILLSRNTRDFNKVPGLFTEDWTI